MSTRLRALLSQPTERSWQQICRILRTDPAQVVLCRDALAGWPDDLPRRPDPTWTDPLFFPDTPGPLLLLQLANTLHGPPGVQRLEDTGAERVAACRHLSGIRTLSLPDQDLTDAGVLALAASPHLAGVRTLDLTANELGAAAIRAIARGFPALRQLRLTSTGLSAGAAAALARGPWPWLTHLHLDHNPLGPRGARALADSAALHSLRHLDLSACQLDEPAVLALAASPHLAGLTHLRLAGCRLTAAGRTALRARWPDRRW